MKRLALLALLAVSPVHADEFIIKDLSGGMYSNPSANRIPDNAATTIENFYTDVEPVAIERNGFEKKDSTVLGGTKPVTGLWEFVDNTGRQWIISYSSRTFYKNEIGGTPTAFGLTATVSQIPDCAVNLGKIWCVNGTDAGWSFDGTSTSTVSGMPLGTLIEPWRNRLIISNIGSAQSTVRVSADGDGTDWTLGSLATSPFAFQIGGANDGFSVTCLWKSYLDNFVIGRKKDLWYLSGFDQDDYQVRNVSAEIGCIQQGSMREFDGSLLFMSGRGMEEARGYTITHISEPVRNITDEIVKNTASTRSNTQTSQSDFQAGTISTTLLAGGDLSTVVTPGSVRPSTNTPTGSFVDSTLARFNQGTITTLINDGDLTLSTGAAIIRVGYVKAPDVTTNDGSDYGTPMPAIYQSFTATQSYFVTDVTINTRASFNSTGPDDHVVLYDSRSDGSPGVALGTAPFDTRYGYGLPDAMETTFRFSNRPSITSGSTYWLGMTGSGLEPGRGVKWFSGVYTSTYAVNGSSYTTRKMIYTINGATYNSTGNIVSRTFNIGASTHEWAGSYYSMIASGSVPSNTTLTFETQSSPDGVSFEPLVAVSTPGGPLSLFQQYIRYKVSFNTTCAKKALKKRWDSRLPQGAVKPVFCGVFCDIL